MRILKIAIFCLCSIPLHASESEVRPATSLSNLAQQADVIALVQVKDTDYSYRRQFPVSGSAYLEVLIGYQQVETGDLIEVAEKGMRETACYFPNPDVFEEGRRYLVFLRSDPKKPERFRGLVAGCALDILVKDDNQYVVRLPATGIALTDDLAAVSRDYTFNDPYALVSAKSISSTQQKIWLELGLLQPYESASTNKKHGALGAMESDSQRQQWIYTGGVELTTVRKLMFPETTQETMR